MRLLITGTVESAVDLPLRLPPAADAGLPLTRLAE